MKYFLIIGIILLSMVPLTSAITSDLRASYHPGETMLVALQGSILEPLDKTHVTFYRGHVQTVFEYDLKKIGDHYFLYAIAPNSQNNYTLAITGIVTTVNGETQTLEYLQNFSVSGESYPYTLRPGFIIAQDDFTVHVFLNRDQEQTIAIGANNNSQKLLKPGDNQLSFSIAEFDQGVTLVPIGAYILPVYNLRAKDANLLPETKHLRFFPGPLREVRVYGVARPLSFKIINIGSEDIDSFAFQYNANYYSLQPEKISKLRVNESAEFNLTLKQSNKTIDDTLVIHAGNETLEIPVYVEYIQNQTTTNVSSNLTQAAGYYCSELNGKLCSTQEQCSGNVSDSINGPCCLGSCIVPEKPSYAWVGYLLGALVLIVLVIIGGRYMKNRKGNVFEKKVVQIEKSRPSFS